MSEELIRRTGLCIEKGSLVEVLLFPTGVAGIGCDEADHAMRGLAVVPIDKPLYLGLCLRLVAKPLVGQSSLYLQVRSSASEHGLSLLTRGRL